MAVFKCKMCGGDLEVQEGMTVCECEYCGTNQTIPTTDSEKLTNLYNRANRLRFNNEFDKAAGVFENIAAEFPEEAEAYWGLCLCKYGIEYVDDPATGKKIPTCHRTSLESIFDDSNFDLAQEYADSVAQRLYREEAKEIDRLQKAILDIAKNEKPYDIFICYKETAPDGQRTKDSVMAQDIYDALAAKGYKVFFARITLEDKLGQEYEPYIFAALSSAKIMLSVGTSYDNFNAVWVKNEWSRFLAMMKTDKSKVLIPCYCDCDAYDMPQEFKNLQGQDMGKVGFIQDLVRGIGKIIPAPNDVAQNTVQQTVVQQVVSSNAENLLKRGFMSLEDSDWSEAEKFFERVLDENAEEPRAYIGKLLFSFRVKNEDELVKSAPTNCLPLSENVFFKKAYRFAGDEYKAHLKDLNRLYTSSSEIRHFTDVIKAIHQKFSDGMKLYDLATTEKDFLKAKAVFDSLSNYPPAKEKADECAARASDSKEKSYNSAVCLMNMGDYLSAIASFRSLNGYKDSVDQIYNCAVAAMNNGKYLIAVFAFRIIKGYKDSSELLKECQRHIPNRCISASSHTVVGLRKDGTVIAAGDSSDGKCDVSDWQNVVAVSAGSFHTVGLKADGTVVGAGYDSNGSLKVSGWNNMVDVLATGFITIGLKSDGKVVATGHDKDKLCSFFSDWTDIVDISISKEDKYQPLYAIGLKKNGTVIANLNVSGWRDIVAVSAGSKHLVGLKSDGTVVATGDNEFGQCNVSKWRDIVSIDAGKYATVGLKADGTVVATRHSYGESEWTDIVAVTVGFGLKSDGTVVTTNKSLDVSNWKLCTDRTLLEKERQRRKELIDQQKREQEARRKQEIAEKNESLRKQIAELEKQKEAVRLTMSEIKGLFAGAKKKKLEDIKDSIEGQIRALNMQITKE